MTHLALVGSLAAFMLCTILNSCGLDSVSCCSDSAALADADAKLTRWVCAAAEGVSCRAAAGAGTGINGAAPGMKPGGRTGLAGTSESVAAES